MKAAVIKLKNYSAGITGTLDGRKRVFRTLILCLGMLAASYLILLTVTVWNIVERRGLEAKARELGNAVGELEFTYFSSLQMIDPALSKDLGFTEVKPKFVTRRAYERVTAKNIKPGDEI